MKLSLRGWQKIKSRHSIGLLQTIKLVIKIQSPLIVPLEGIVSTRDHVAIIYLLLLNCQLVCWQGIKTSETGQPQIVVYISAG